jgi:hypothetical protein
MPMRGRDDAIVTQPLAGGSSSLRSPRVVRAFDSLRFEARSKRGRCFGLRLVRKIFTEHAVAAARPARVSRSTGSQQASAVQAVALRTKLSR